MNSIKTMLVTFAIAAMFSLTTVMAVTPHLISFQGYVTDTADNPISSGDLKVEIYENSGDSTPYWSNEYLNAFENGIFDVLLGSVVSLNLDNTEDYFMSVYVKEAGSYELVINKQIFYPGSGDHTHTHVAEDITGGTLTVDGINVDSYTLFTSSDQVGIGGMYGAKLTVWNDDSSTQSGLLNLVSHNGMKLFSFWEFQNDGMLYILDHEGGSPRIVFHSDAAYPSWFNAGNVGIGTTDPDTKLDVAGTCTATDFECTGCIDSGDIDSSQVQERVSDTCPVGQSIRAISDTGSVTCEVDDNSGGTVTQINTGVGLTGGPITISGTIAHEDTSSQASSDNSGTTYIQDVTLDGFGHVTGLATATATLDCTMKTDNSAGTSVTTPSCDAGYELTGGGCKCGSITDSPISESHHSGDAWFCECTVSGHVEAWAICCRII